MKGSNSLTIFVTLSMNVILAYFAATLDRKMVVCFKPSETKHLVFPKFGDFSLFWAIWNQNIQKIFYVSRESIAKDIQNRE